MGMSPSGLIPFFYYQKLNAFYQSMTQAFSRQEPNLK